MGNFSQSPAAVLKQALDAGYHRVRFQQGKPVLDRELNLAADLASPQRIARSFVGNGVAPGGRAFRIAGSPATGDFTIEAGAALVDGLEVRLPANTTYLTQPVRAGLAALPAGPSHIYLRVSTREVAAAQDATLGNAGDVGFETAVRDKTDWQVIASVPLIQTSDHLHLADIDTTANTVADQRVVDVNLARLAAEIASARGSAAAVGARLDASLAADGTVAANAVDTAMLVDGAVTAAKLRSHATDNAQRAVGRQHVQNAAVSLTQLATTVLIDADFSVPASPGAGQVGETIVPIEITEALPFYLISVRYVGPRPIVAPPAFVSTLTWTQRSTLFKLSLAPAAPVRLRNELLLQNPNASAITAHVRVLRLEEA